MRLQEERVRQAEEEVQSRLQAALEAMKERKAMEKLRERRLAEHLAEAAREDIRAMDEAPPCARRPLPDCSRSRTRRKKRPAGSPAGQSQTRDRRRKG